MANHTIKKKILVKGDKGSNQVGGNDTTVPQEGIVAFDGDTIPQGYELYKETGVTNGN